MTETWPREYVGIPFQWGGYSRAGAGCWGLVWLVQREVFGRALPRHDEWNAQVADGADDLDATLWQSGIACQPVALAEAVAGDVLHMFGVHHGRKIPLHVGVYTKPFHVLHTEGGTGAIVEDMRTQRARWRPIQAYRLV